MSSETWMMSPIVGDHDVVLTLPGIAESLRPSIIEAVAQMDYKVISEQPLAARRRARGSAAWDCSFETLDYPRKLNVSLKQINEVSTVATFSYEIKAYTCLTRGDRRTLDCEARAIAALATQRASAISCSACGTPVTDDSRFCRRCGALVVIEVAEVEVLRLMEDSRRGYHRIAFGAAISLIALLLPIALLWIDTTKAFRVVTMLSSIGAALGVFTLLQGIWTLHRALNPIRDEKLSEAMPESFPVSKTNALPPRSPQLSVTEGTTELLISDEPIREQVPVKRKAVDTAEVR